MESSALSSKIEDLVDHLRKDQPQPMSVVDMASVTEVLVSTMTAYLGSVDKQIYDEFRSLSSYIARAKAEIQALEPQQLSDHHIPQAGEELSAIVTQTETATHSIMSAAEALLAVNLDEAEPARAALVKHTTEIFEACSFQDITGQRISKVIETLNHIDRRLADLTSFVDGNETAASILDGKSRDKLLNGPSLNGAGVDQSQVDALLA